VKSSRQPVALCRGRLCASFVSSYGRLHLAGHGEERRERSARREAGIVRGKAEVKQAEEVLKSTRALVVEVRKDSILRGYATHDGERQPGAGVVQRRLATCRLGTRRAFSPGWPRVSDVVSAWPWSGGCRLEWLMVKSSVPPIETSPTAWRGRVAGQMRLGDKAGTSRVLLDPDAHFQ
jgi:hypothetical protein